MRANISLDATTQSIPSPKTYERRQKELCRSSFPDMNPGSFDALPIYWICERFWWSITDLSFIIWFRTDVKVKDATRRGRVGIQSVTDMSKKFSHNNGSTWQVHSYRTSVICTLTCSQNSRQTPFNGCISRNLTNLL